MNPNMSLTAKEFAGVEAADRSPIGAALEELDSAKTAVEKAFSLLRERVEPVTQPEEPMAIAPLSDDERPGRPESVVLRRINESVDDLRSLAGRMHRLADRLDV